MGSSDFQNEPRMMLILVLKVYKNSSFQGFFFTLKLDYYLPHIASVVGHAGCDQPLGMEDGRIKDRQITASSERLSAGGKNFPAKYARLNYNIHGEPTGWRPRGNDLNQWIQVDLRLQVNSLLNITGVITQGISKLWVTRYNVRYSTDELGVDWISVLTKNQSEVSFD